MSVEIYDIMRTGYDGGRLADYMGRQNEDQHSLYKGAILRELGKDLSMPCREEREV